MVCPDYGMMMGFGGFSTLYHLLITLLLLGLVILVYLWIVKLWREIRRKRR